MNQDQLTHIHQCRAMMRYAAARMAATFAAVPEDRLEWRPAPTAKSGLQVISHAVDANRQVTKVIRGDIAEAAPDWEFLLESKAAALAELAKSVQDFEAVLDGVTEKDFERTAESPAGPLPISEWMHFIGHHLAEHAGQIDYLQTCWDDQISHYPAEATA